MTSTPQASSAGFAQTARILAAALMGGLVFIGVAMFFVLGTEQTPPLWVVLALLALGVVSHLVIETVGYRLRPLESDLGDDAAAREARTRWQAAMIQRFAISELAALGALVLAFVIDGGVWVYVLGALVSLALMAIHVWPGARSVARSAEALEANGRPSHLREAFGHTGPGPIQQF